MKEAPFREKNLSIPVAAGSSPSMPLLVFWPLLAPRRCRCFSALRSASWVNPKGGLLLVVGNEARGTRLIKSLAYLLPASLS